MIDRERVEEFIELHRIQVVLALSAVRAIIVVLLVVSAIAGRHGKRQDHAREIAALSIKAGDFWLPDEPLRLPGVQLFREPEEKWTPVEIKRWYTVPDSKALGELRSAGKKTVDEILESVP